MRTSDGSSSASSSAISDSGVRSLYTSASDGGSSQVSTIPKKALEQPLTQSIDNSEFEQMQLQAEEALLKSLHNPQDIRIHEFIKSKMPNACLIQNVGSELTYSISNKPEFTRHYNKFFNQLEINSNKLGIESIGLSDSTLEEIFIKLAKQPENNRLAGSDKKLFGFINLTVIWERIISCTCFCPNRGKKYQTGSLSEAEITQFSEFTKLRVSNRAFLVFQQLYALLIKRFHRVKRNIKGFFAEIVLPVVFVCLALLVATLNPAESSEPALEIHPWYYGTPNQIFISKSPSYAYDAPNYGKTPFMLNLNPKVQSNIDQVNKVYNTFLKSPGPGTRCMSNYQIIVPRRGGDRPLECYSFENELNNNYTELPSSMVSAFQSVNYTYSKTGPKCDCSNGFPECSDASAGDIYFRPVYTLQTQDVLYDLSGRNISDWIINTEFSERIFKKRFGGYEFLRPFLNPGENLMPNLVDQVQKFAVNFQSLLKKALPSGNFNGLEAATSTLISDVRILILHFTVKLL
jgi:hypothetical protein